VCAFTMAGEYVALARRFPPAAGVVKNHLFKLLSTNPGGPPAPPYCCPYPCPYCTLLNSKARPSSRPARAPPVRAPRPPCPGAAVRPVQLTAADDGTKRTPPLPTVAPTHVPIVHSLDPRDETGSPGRRRARHPYSSRCIPGAAARARKKGALSIVSSVTLQSSSDLIWRVGPPAGERRVAGERMCGLEGGGGGCPISTRGVSD